MPNVVVHLQPGSFFAGINRPWYASQAAVRNALRSSFGFGAVTFHGRSVPLPAAVRARLSAAELADTGWDEWLEASYSGPRRDVAHSKQWSWLVEPASAPAKPSPARPSPSPALPPPKAPAPPGDAFPTRPAPWAGEGASTHSLGAVAAGAVLLIVALSSWAVLRGQRGR